MPSGLYQLYGVASHWEKRRGFVELLMCTAPIQILKSSRCLHFFFMSTKGFLIYASCIIDELHKKLKCRNAKFSSFLLVVIYVHPEQVIHAFNKLDCEVGRLYDTNAFGLCFAPVISLLVRGLSFTFSALVSFHFFWHCFSWMEIDADPYSLPQR